ncbi:MAG: hypothetical protein K6F98_08910 [Bacteroidales bacterium]|nr:hypothetical protein [Bacteroidales bacterium]
MKHLLIMALLMAAIVYVFFFMPLGDVGPYRCAMEASDGHIASVQIPLKRLNKELPEDWEPYDYMVLEMRTSTAQRFLLGIETDSAIHEKRTHLLPKAWVRVSIPLAYYREKPAPGADLAATVNKPLTVGFMHIEGGTVGPLDHVKGLSLRMYTPLDHPVIEIRSLTLSKEDAGNAYLDTVPYIDRFGQWALEDFEGKVHSEEELRAAWAVEDDSLEWSRRPYSASRYGGFAGLFQPRLEATGVFRVTCRDSIWWFVDPDGYLFLSTGVNGLSPGGGGNISRRPGLEHLYETAAEPAGQDNAGGRGAGRGGFGGASFGQQNLQLRYGNDSQWRDRWAEKTRQRMEVWGLNTGGNGKPYMGYMSVRVPMVAGLQDVYGEQFGQQVEDALRANFENNRHNPLLIGYFSGNEPAWLFQEERVCSLILEAGDSPMQRALKAWLAAGDTPERRRQFVYDTFRKYLTTIKQVKDKYDPEHLNLGIRFGQSVPPSDEILQICKDLFDVFSFNTYREAPNREYMDYVYGKTGLPMILGEFHFGTIDRGMAPGLVQVADQRERAVAYQYFSEQAFSHPALIGTAWFQYNDQGLTGRGDGERYNIGLVDVTDRPYPITGGIAWSANRMYGVHAGTTEPTTRRAKGIQGNEDDLVSSSNQ